MPVTGRTIIVIAWQIRPDRSPEPEEGAASRVDIRLVPVEGGKTEMVLVHRDFPRHGEGWEKYKTQMAAKEAGRGSSTLYKAAADKLGGMTVRDNSPPKPAE